MLKVENLFLPSGGWSKPVNLRFRVIFHNNVKTLVMNTLFRWNKKLCKLSFSDDFVRNANFCLI